MSSSYKSLYPASSPAPIEVFSYPDSHRHDEADSIAANDGVVNPQSDEMAQLLLRAHAEGVCEGEERERVRSKEQLEQKQAMITEAILRFQTDAADYYARAEAEVVQLAVGMARKVLRRETQSDSTLLVKIAKSVLAQLHQNSKVMVLVPPGQVQTWRDEFAAHGDGKVAIEVIPDESIAPDNCRLETELGATELGLEAQLRELENNLFDVLAAEPQ